MITDSIQLEPRSRSTRDVQASIAHVKATHGQEMEQKKKTAPYEVADTLAVIEDEDDLRWSDLFPVEALNQF